MTFTLFFILVVKGFEHVCRDHDFIAIGDRLTGIIRRQRDRPILSQRFGSRPLHGFAALLGFHFLRRPRKGGFGFLRLERMSMRQPVN